MSIGSVGSGAVTSNKTEYGKTAALELAAAPTGSDNGGNVTNKDGMIFLSLPNGQRREKWSDHEIRGYEPIKNFSGEKTPNFGLVDQSKVPQSEPGVVKYAEEPPPPPVERTIEVAGTGMGAAKKYTMLESEALAVYTILRDNKGAMPVEELQKKLKDNYGIDADIKTIDGKKALVNKATGNSIAVDTNGDGSLDLTDLHFKEALKEAGIDPDWKADGKVFDLAIGTVKKALDLSSERDKLENELYEAKLAARKAEEKAAEKKSGSSQRPAVSATV